MFTGEGDRPQPLAVRFVGDRIDQVCLDGTQPPPDPGEDVVDLAGATVLPGLLDVHTHPAFMSELVDAVSLLPPEVDSIESLVARLRSSGAGSLPERPNRLAVDADFPPRSLAPHSTRQSSPRRSPGRSSMWIAGYGFDESGYPEGRQPTRHDLDRVSATRPVFARRCDGHTAVCNTVALELAGITAETPDPPGAAYGRDASGMQDGRLIEVAAVERVHGLIPVPDEKERVTRIARLARHFAERGLVGLGDLFATMVPDPLRTFRAAARLGPFPQVGLYLGWEHIKADPPTLTDDDRTGRIHIAGCKLLMDGAYSNRTAWTHDPYPDSCDHGIPTTTVEELRAAGAWARSNGVQVAVHAMGDAALDAVIDTFADEDPWLDDVPSVRLEHATLFSPERIARVGAARMRFAVVSHTIFLFAEYGSYESNLSPAQFAIAYPIRSFHEGLRATALSSDSPATAWEAADDVFVSVQAAVERRSHTGADIGQSEAVSVAQALELYTSRAATCMRLPGLGRIAEGAEASLVVLDRDIFAVPPEQLAQTRVVQTWMAGSKVSG